MIQTGSGRRWLLLGWVAKRVGVSRQAVHKRIAEGKLTTWPLNKRGDLTVLVEDVEAWERERARRRGPGGPT